MNFLPLSTVARFINGDRGKNYPGDNEQMIAGYCLFLSTKNVRKGEFDFSDCRFISEEKHMLLGGGTLEAGDIVLTIRGTIGNTAIYDERCKYRVARINSAMIIVRPSPQYEAQFIQWFLRSPAFQQWTDNSRRGTAQPHLRAEDLEKAAIPLCSSGQQRRIVAKLDALDASAKRARADLDRIPTLVARAKQAILAETYTGPMTTIESVAESLDQGWSPKCDNVPATSDDDWAVMTTTAIQALKFSGAENKVLPRSVEPRPKLELAPGDFLVTRAGPRSRVGVVCVVERTRPRVMLCDKAYRLRFKSNTDPFYVAMMCNSPQAQHEIELMKTGGNDSGLNLTQAKFLALPIPQRSLQEQREIVRRIETAFAKIDRIAAEAASARALLDRLDQAILAKAFRGELVPQDPNDEPAEKLLEKIKAARAAPPARKTRKKQS